jgi:hypothetical protein
LVEEVTDCREACDLKLLASLLPVRFSRGTKELSVLDKTDDCPEDVVVAAPAAALELLLLRLLVVEPPREGSD